jgi:hypothetical protein
MVEVVAFWAQDEKEITRSNENKAGLYTGNNRAKKISREIILRINAEAVMIFYKEDLKLNTLPKYAKI